MLAPANVDGLENIVVSERGPSLKAAHLVITFVACPDQQIHRYGKPTRAAWAQGRGAPMKDGSY